MSDEQDNWNTHASEPYVSEYILPLGNRKPDEEYTYDDLCLETFSLMLWKYQEEYHLDYESAFILAGRWRLISDKRLSRLFGKDVSYLNDRQEMLWSTHGFDEMEKELPKRNLPRMTPLDYDWQEDDAYSFL